MEVVGRRMSAVKCDACAHLALRSVDVGGMWVALWGCLELKKRFGQKLENLPENCKKWKPKE